MEALLAMGLINMGRNLVGNIVDGLSSSSSESFGDVLTSEVNKTTSASTGQDSGALQTKITQLGKRLSATPEVRSFIGTDNTFTVIQDGNGFVIQREDGTEMRLPKNSAAETMARDLNACNVAAKQLAGESTLPSECKWLVAIKADAVTV